MINYCVSSIFSVSICVLFSERGEMQGLRRSISQRRKREGIRSAPLLFIFFSSSPCSTYCVPFPPFCCRDKLLHVRLINCCVVLFFLFCACFVLVAASCCLLRVPHPRLRPLLSPLFWGSNSITCKGGWFRHRGSYQPPSQRRRLRA